MQDGSTNTGKSRITQPWTPDDLELLRMMAPNRWRGYELMQRFPGHSLNAIKKQLSMTRRAVGIPPRTGKWGCERAGPTEINPTMLDPDEPGVSDCWQEQWRAMAEVSNAMFIAALMKVA